MGATLGSVLVALVVSSLGFSALERWRPAVAALRRARVALTTDLAYWFFNPLVTGVASRVAVAAGIVVLLALAGSPIDRLHAERLLAGRGPVAAWPLPLQVAAVLLVGDLIGYWMHRWFHRGWPWRVHAVHHSSTTLDWLAAARVHPANEIASRVVRVTGLVVLGFPVGVLAAYVPFLTLYAILLHANVPWTFGPLRRVLASPTFHRWHHTAERAGLDRNFAGLFPFIDVAFGTFHMPPERQPRAFGVRGEPVPEGFLAQLAHPFRSAGLPASPARSAERP